MEEDPWQLPQASRGKSQIGSGEGKNRIDVGRQAVGQEVVNPSRDERPFLLRNEGVVNQSRCHAMRALRETP